MTCFRQKKVNNNCLNCSFQSSFGLNYILKIYFFKVFPIEKIKANPNTALVWTKYGGKFRKNVDL